MFLQQLLATFYLGSFDRFIKSWITEYSSMRRSNVGMSQLRIHAAQITRPSLEVLILNTTDKLRFQRDLFLSIVIDVQNRQTKIQSKNLV